ncbi:Ig-like domain-containing protein, partial [Photobacterium iliopiscarium]
DYLPPISRTMSESSTLTLDKDDLLIETGFDIDPNSIYLIGETKSGDVGNVETDGNSIIYTSPDDTTGIVRVFYSERNVDSTIVKPGVIYIAIGQKNNTNPQANDAELEPMALTDIKREISVKDLISDLDKDSLKLIDIKSILGSTTINSNDSFIYTPSISGKEVLTYIISDHNGG